MMNKVFSRIFAISIAWVLLIGASNAVVTVDQAFSFGTIALRNNTIVHDLTVQTDGSYTTSVNGFVVISPPQPGIFTINGLPVDTAVSSITVAVTVAMQNGASETFTQDNFTIDAPASTTGDELQITVGGQLHTTGTTSPYIDGGYSSTLEITFNF